MRLYVANGTKQTQLLYYRVPESGQRGPITIPIGGQQQLPEELPPNAIDMIIQHQSRYGFVPEDEIDRIRSDYVVPLCYSLDKPIKSEKIKNLLDRNEAILSGRGKQARQDAGISASVLVNEALLQQRPGDRIGNFEVEITEENRDPRDTSPEISEGIRVATDPAEAGREAKPRGRRR